LRHRPGRHATAEIANRVFYALHDTATPVRVAVGTVSINILLSLILMRTPLSFGGLALASSIAALIEATLLAWLLSGRLRGAGVDFALARISRPLGGFVLAALPMGAVSYVLLQVLVATLDTSRLLAQLIVIAVVGLVGGLVYVLLSAAFGSEELRTLLRLLRPRRHAA